MSAPALYTCGYEGLSIDDFITRIVSLGIRTVVDVRELPLSRKKGFSKRAFSARLAEAGIAYVHVPALGCPKRVRDEYRIDRDWPRYTRGYMQHLATQAPGVRELAKLARGTVSCLVCFEQDYSQCHRTFVARAAHRVGAPAVKHITSRTVAPDQPLRAVA